MAQAIRDEVIEELLQGYSSPQDLDSRRGGHAARIYKSFRLAPDPLINPKSS